MDEKLPQGDATVVNSAAENSGSSIKIFFEKVKSKIPNPSFVQTFLIPATVVFLVLLIGGGGTYLIASNVMGKNTSPPSSISSISESNIPTVAVSTPTPIPMTPTPTVSVAITTNLVASAAAGWTPYTFTQLFFSFSFPPQWFVVMGGTSGPPYLTVQNFSGSTPINIQGKYSILISRFEQVGITSVSNLTTQLAINAASNTFINGINMGQVTVLSAAQKAVNGHPALERTVSYSAFPTRNYYELYILDGVSNVIRLMPQLDTVYGKPYFDTLVSTIKFTK